MRETSTICRASLCHRVSKFPLSPFFSLFRLYESFVSRFFVWGIMAKRAGELCCKCRKYQSFLDKILQIHNRKVERKSLRSLSSTLHLKNKFFFSRYCLYFWRKRFRCNIKCFFWHLPCPPYTFQRISCAHDAISLTFWTSMAYMIWLSAWRNL